MNTQVTKKLQIPAQIQFFNKYLTTDYFTGEFEFQCKKCLKAISQDLHKECNSKGNTRINGPHDFIDNALYGHVCALCNYIQLSKKNVNRHLEHEHQQLSNDENVVEIILLKSSQPLDLLIDDKNDKSLIEAKQRNSVIQSTWMNRYEDMDEPFIPDEEDGASGSPPIIVDLTCSDDES